MARSMRLGHDETEQLPAWFGEEYGWDTVADVKWDMLRQNLASMDHVLSNPAKFPKADYAKLEARSVELFAFLASHLES